MRLVFRGNQRQLHPGLAAIPQFQPAARGVEMMGIRIIEHLHKPKVAAPAESGNDRAVHLIGPKVDVPLDLCRGLRKTFNCCMSVKSSARKSRSTREKTRALDVQIQFMEGVVRRDPRYVEALQLLGDNYTKRGRYSEGLGVDERLAELEPANPLVFYNLSCSYSLLDRCDDAANALERALSLGYRDFKWLIKDPDLKKLRAHPRYKAIRAEIKRIKSQED